MLCEHCGTIVPDDSKFCEQCGANLAIHRRFDLLKWLSSLDRKRIMIFTVPVASLFSAVIFAILLTTFAAPMYGPDALQQQGTSPFRGPEKPEIRNKISLGGKVRVFPAVGPDGTIYIGSEDNYIYAFSPQKELKWKVKTGFWVRSAPVLASDGTVYVGSWDNHLYAISPKGQVQWKLPTNAPINSSPTIGADGTIYVGSSDGCLYAAQPNGQLKWKIKTGNPVCAAPIISSTGTIYLGADGGYLYAVGEAQ